KARLWDVGTGESRGVLSGHEKLIRAVVFRPKSSQVVTASEDGTARLWDSETQKLVVEPLKHEKPVSAVALSPDGTLLATGSQDTTVRLWEPTGALSKVLGHLSAITSVAFSPDGKTLLVSEERALSQLWDVKSHKLIFPDIRSLLCYGQTGAFSGDGQTLL